MPTPATSRWLKGAIVAIDLANQSAQPTTIAFQYNPDTLSRTLTPQHVGGERGSRSQVTSFAGAPEETINLDVAIDAVDRLERGDAQAAEMGIYPQLAALEILMYPQSAQVSARDALLDKGQIEIGKGLFDAPLTLFVWGPKRVLPVQLTSCSISEEMFDSQLNPIRATVKLGLRALSYSDLDKTHKGYNLFMAYQKNKERMATRGVTGNAKDVIGFDIAARLR